MKIKMRAKVVKQELKEEIIEESSESYETGGTMATTNLTPGEMLVHVDDVEFSNFEAINEFDVPAMPTLNIINDSANFSLRIEDDEDDLSSTGNVPRACKYMQNLCIDGDETKCDSCVVPASDVETSANTFNGISTPSIKARTRQSLRNETTNRNFARSKIPSPVGTPVQPSTSKYSSSDPLEQRLVRPATEPAPIQKMPDMLKISPISPKRQEIKLRSSVLQQLLKKCCITCSTFYDLGGPEEFCEQCGTALFCKCILCDAMVFVSLYGLSRHAMDFHHIEMPMIARPEPLDAMGIKRLCVHHCKHCNNSCKVMRETLITCQNCNSRMAFKCLICKKTFETVEETLNHINATHHSECDETRSFSPSSDNDSTNRPINSPTPSELIIPKSSKRTRSLNESIDESMRQGTVVELNEPNDQGLNDDVDPSETASAINTSSIENFASSSRRAAQKKRKISKPMISKSTAVPPRKTQKATAAAASPIPEAKQGAVTATTKKLRSSLKKTQKNDVISEKLRAEQNESINDQNLDSTKQATFVKISSGKNKVTYSCTKCQFKSMVLTGINHHIRAMHRLTRRSEPVHLQVEANESIRSRRSLQNLSSNSVDGKKKCLKCGQFYTQMIEHEKICISNLNIYKCPFCTFKCHSKLDMKDHITNNNHLLDEVTKEDSNESNIDAEIICTACKDVRNDLVTTYRAKCKLCNSSMTYRCIKCKTEFNSKREFSKHVRLEHTIKS
ncbi:uncharacterized protein LOC106651381 isoform X2 [Trichogramma pretiosum]|uniref:uncharacterized protein LOC106651381 isoform X2 n=1 Tax=Trichogramma pretiosum TaxID=7493 RepID=UPI0006C9945D|nr:uncharacterized protein LOC106651381 isoform X2 [Trichogramma pretiosum]